ncbi:Acyl-CoA carboxylase epsilon subunit [Amycolatopsis regifaucium]|nr:Acyl-CoA carboxylase epsilon subunit [Amycolatopsis regifaucium]
MPVFRILRGDPEDLELAALVAVFGALASAAVPPAVPVWSAWSARGRADWRTSVLR